jgi:O-antigen/teichoic acid export membrane protein
VRQALIIPAVSASAAYFPLAVQILANRGAQAVRAHLEECIEFLLVIVLPACLGFAVVSHHIANVVLGAEFRSMASAVMPVVSLAVIFQIIACQYFHISFLLSGRNMFYLLHTGSVLIFNAIVCWLLITRLGTIGAAWARLAAEVFGFVGAGVLTLWAFPVPLPFRRLTRVLAAAVAMAVLVRGLDTALALSDRDALIVLLLAGITSYAALCWFLDLARTRQRLSRGLLILRNKTVH